MSDQPRNTIAQGAGVESIPFDIHFDTQQLAGKTRVQLPEGDRGDFEEYHRLADAYVRLDGAAAVRACQRADDCVVLDPAQASAGAAIALTYQHQEELFRSRRIVRALPARQLKAMRMWASEHCEATVQRSEHGKGSEMRCSSRPLNTTTAELRAATAPKSGPGVNMADVQYAQSQRAQERKEQLDAIIHDAKGAYFELSWKEETGESQDAAVHRLHDALIKVLEASGEISANALVHAVLAEVPQSMLGNAGEQLRVIEETAEGLIGTGYHYKLGAVLERWKGTPQALETEIRKRTGQWSGGRARLRQVRQEMRELTAEAMRNPWGGTVAEAEARREKMIALRREEVRLSSEKATAIQSALLLRARAVAEIYNEIVQ